MHMIILILVVVLQFGAIYLVREFYESKIEVISHANDLLRSSNETLSKSFSICETSKKTIEETSLILMEDATKISDLRNSITSELCDAKWNAPSLYLVETRDDNEVIEKKEHKNETKYINPTDTFSPDIIRLLDKAYDSTAY